MTARAAAAPPIAASPGVESAPLPPASGPAGAGGWRLGTSAAAGLPRVEAFVAGLKGGIDAHPTCVAKGSLVRNLLEGQPAEALASGLPPSVRRLALDPPVGSEWIPEAYLTALYLGLADVRGWRDEDLLAFARDRNRALFRSSAYRFLMEAVSPAMLMRFGSQRWANFHRGTTLEQEGVADEGVRFILRFPEGLFPPLMLAVYAQAFVAALELARARFPDVRVEACDACSARFLATWS